MNLFDFRYSAQVASQTDGRIKTHTHTHTKSAKKNRIFKIQQLQWEKKNTRPDLNSIWIHVSFRFEIEVQRMENQKYVITR